LNRFETIVFLSDKFIMGCFHPISFCLLLQNDDYFRFTSVISLFGSRLIKRTELIAALRFYFTQNRTQCQR